MVPKLGQLVQALSNNSMFYKIYEKYYFKKYLPTLVDGEAADKNVPNANDACTTKTIIATHVKNLHPSLFKFAIQ
jgi:hypothetical protein